ncbi:YfcE family phosphodiesterase [Alkalibaculum sp. M08DMB]|uniref:Phosphoesterase n=1 Tax=Alkalibaculum sporogenes TaxID=2655001 RepID=A0A6A7K656_9FIRM|nr:metallophosphoesterase [Alkalibaculum sporogenes]MPW24928.1 YfcE family phosphodiesterase [Alkalibaculum sporogenes]
MKILVFSDSHGNLNSATKVIEEVKNVDMIFHLGDNVRDALKIEKIVPYPVKYVKGNTDIGDAPTELIEEINGSRLLMTHGHKYGIKANLHKLYNLAVEKGVKVVLYGHSHVPSREIIGGILFLNPGSIGDRRQQPNETYGLIDIDIEGNVQAEIMNIYRE